MKQTTIIEIKYDHGGTERELVQSFDDFVTFAEGLQWDENFVSLELITDGEIALGKLIKHRIFRQGSVLRIRHQGKEVFARVAKIISNEQVEVRLQDHQKVVIATDDIIINTDFTPAEDRTRSKNPKLLSVLRGKGYYNIRIDFFKRQKGVSISGWYITAKHQSKPSLRGKFADNQKEMLQKLKGAIKK